MLLDVAGGTAQTLSMGRARRVPARGYLAAQLRAGEPVWVHLDGDPQGESVRFSFLSGGAETAAAVEAIPERRAAGEFLFTAPLGPPTFLALSVKPGHTPPVAQFWVGTIKSPGYRWELWEEQAKKWAKQGNGQLPPPPDSVGEPLLDKLTVLEDALKLAQAESSAGAAGAVPALLQAEALLANLPAREPVFPYFRRKELTTAVAPTGPMQVVEGLRMVEVKQDVPARFTVEGPAILRIEARAQYAESSPYRSVPLTMLLSSGSRLVAVTAEEVAPHAEPESKLFSSQRRMLLTAAPGRHEYELRIRGGSSLISVITHTRVIHAEQLANHAEDLPRLLEKARGASGLLGQLIDAELSFLMLEDERAKAGFAKVLESTRAPRIGAFALLRLLALSSNRSEAAALHQRALALLGEQPVAKEALLRNLIVAEYLTHVIAATDPGIAAPADAVALLRRTPEALPYMLGLVGPMFRYLPRYRSLALPLLAAAQRQAPLDVALRHAMSREWYTGSRWTALPTVELSGGERVDLRAPPREAITCAEAEEEGVPAFVPLRDSEVRLDVEDRLAPPKSLHRFHLIALRSGSPGLRWAELALDGKAAQLPLLLDGEPIPFALAAGRHTLRATMASAKGSSKAGDTNQLLAPCLLLGRSNESALLIEHRYSLLKVRGAQARVMLLEPGTPGFLGLELRGSPALRGGRVVLRTDQGVLGHVDLDGHARDEKALGESVGPSVVVVFPVPANARILDIVREDNGAPLLVSARLRRSLAGQRRIESRLPDLEHSPQQLEQLRQATRALRKAQTPNEQVRARLARAEVLLALGAQILARADLEHALPSLSEEGDLMRARALMAETAGPPLLVRGPQTPGAVLLAAGAELSASDAERSCIDSALAQFAKDPAAGRSAAQSCKGALALYSAARLQERGGSVERAAENYAAAYTTAEPRRSALAREAALRYADRGPGKGSQLGLALATAAAIDGDPDGDRAVHRLQGFTHLTPVRGIDSGLEARTKEQSTPMLSLRAALADEPWEPGQFLELKAGKSAETDFQIGSPLHARIDAFCDDAGTVPASGPSCSLRVEVDGAKVDAEARTLRAGERASLADLSLKSGAHRVKVLLGRSTEPARAYVHIATSRPLSGIDATRSGDGDFGLPISAPPILRFTSTKEESVQLRAQGPTVLRVDTLVAPASSKTRALAVEVTAAGRTQLRREYPLCTQPAEKQGVRGQPGFDCRTMVSIPLVEATTYQIKLAPIGTSSVAMAMSLYADEPAEAPIPFIEPAFPEQPLVAERSPVLSTLPPPVSNLVRGLGTLQIEQIGVFGTAGRDNPQIGDNYGQTAIRYRRKLDAAPLWFKGAAYLRERNGPLSFGAEGLAFARIPVVELRIYTQLQVFTQRVNDKQEVGLGFHSYLERSFALVPHLFLLPRFAFTASYQSLGARPESTSVDPAEMTPTTQDPIDLQVFNQFDANHRTGLYGQLMLWGVPFINMISYAAVRVSSSGDIRQLDSVRGQVGIDVAFHTTELLASYQLAYFLSTDARRQSLLQNELATAIKQTLWINRNHRIGLQIGANVEVASAATTGTLGVFWEGSHGRGFDDYSTPEINLGQQLGQGRGFLRPEETLR